MIHAGLYIEKGEGKQRRLLGVSDSNVWFNVNSSRPERHHQRDPKTGGRKNEASLWKIPRAQHGRMLMMWGYLPYTTKEGTTWPNT